MSIYLFISYLIKKLYKPFNKEDCLIDLISKCMTDPDFQITLPLAKIKLQSVLFAV
jgi:hypothetical protein